mmetsp:Transcript_118381/g.379516  ORF Transcript_118381/g.379516 Transcript_118381/m.379516 type:complete len:264 (-) Transcript_118381:713-1504(-)
MWGPREGAEAAKGLPGGPLPPGEADGEGSADCIRARPDLTHFCGCCHQPLASVAGIPKEAANPPLPALPAVASAATSKMDKSSAMVSDASSDLSPKCPAKASGGGDAATAAGGADIGTCSGAGDEQEAAPAPPAAEDSGAAQPAGGVANSVADASTSAAAAGAGGGSCGPGPRGEAQQRRNADQGRGRGSATGEEPRGLPARPRSPYNRRSGILELSHILAAPGRLRCWQEGAHDLQKRPRLRKGCVAEGIPPGNAHRGLVTH